MKELEQIENIICMLEDVLLILESNGWNSINIEDIAMTVEDVNEYLYDGKRILPQKIDLYNLDEKIDVYVEEIKRIINIWNKTVNKRRMMSTDVDVEFIRIYEKFCFVSEKDIFDKAVLKFQSLPYEIQLEYTRLPVRYTFLKNTINVIENDFSLIYEHVSMLKQNIDKFKWLYNKLCDYRSKKVLIGIVNFWFEFDIQKLHQMTEGVFMDYFDLDITGTNQNHVFVDLGAYVGDTISDFINTYGKYKRIYGYEITPKTYTNLKNNLSGYDNILIRQQGVGSMKGVMYVDDIENAAGNKLSDKGSIPVEIVTLDDDINEKITMIKMDIEGAEKDALLGSKRHIEEEKPQLLISAYHNSTDIFDIPQMIDNLREDYKFYLRFNGHNGIWPCDYVVLAV